MKNYEVLWIPTLMYKEFPWCPGQKKLKGQILKMKKSQIIEDILLK